MTKLATTLGTAGIAAALLLAAFQVLPPRDGGSAQAGTGPAAPVRAWADPIRADPTRSDFARARTAPAETATQAPAVPANPAADRPAAATKQADLPAAQFESRIERARRRVATQAHRSRTTQAAAQRPAAAAVSGPATSVPAKPAPVRMAGPVGDILHGLGLD